MTHPASAPRAVLTDFGGVLTTSVIDAFSAVSAELTGDPGFLLRLLRDDEPSAQLLVDHECGRLSEGEFENGLMWRLRQHGVTAPDGQPGPAGHRVPPAHDVRPSG